VVHGGVFINYRGEDSHSYGALLHAELSRRFGPDLVFLDSESIPAGADYVQQVLNRVRQARVMLAVIGTRWLAAAGTDGGRRVDDPADWIRRELVEAFAAGVRVIPVLTDGAQMPTEDELPADLAPLGRCQFRRLRYRDASVDLARLVAELADLDAGLGEAAAARPSSPAGWPVPNQLPAAARYFTGRDDELARLLQPGDNARTLVVSAVDGMAGIGKTALAVLAAHQLTEADRYPDGSLFVDLHGYSGRSPTDPADALETLLRGLGVPGPQIPPALDARIALYRTITARRQVLIVLDNARDEAQVRPLLPGRATCLVLVTSRRRMAGLDDADHLTLDTLSPEEAVRLFRAVVGPGRDPGDQHTIEAIVHLCGLLPLAVRIAAARLKTSKLLNGHMLLEHLQVARDQERVQAFDAGGRADQGQDRLGVLDDGERSVLAALEVSYQHLPAEQQQAFAALGVHPGVALEPYATAALLNTSGDHAGRLLEALEQVNLLDQPAPGRYRFHDLTRIYATRHAPASAHGRAAFDRLYDHYAHTASAAMDAAYPYETGQRPPAPTSGTPAPDLADHAAALAWLDAEVANLLATAYHAAAHGRPTHTTHQSTTLHPHLRNRGAYTDAHTLHQTAAELARATGDQPAELAALTGLGWTHRVQGRYGPAADCFTRALELARATGSTSGEINALTGLGLVHYMRGQHGPATDCHTRAAELARATGNPVGELNALTGLGWTHHAQARHGPAADCHTRAAELARATGNPVGELNALTGLGWIHRLQGRYGPAADCFTRALELGHAGNPGGELDALTGLGWIHYMQGRYGPAADCHTRALELARATGNPSGELGALTGLGHTHHAQGHHEPARDCFEQVLDLARTIGNRNGQYEAHLGLGRTHHATGHPDMALTAHQHALDLARELDQPADQARALDGLAHAHYALGQPDQARRHWQHALDILTTLDAPLTEDIGAADIHARLTELDNPTSPQTPPA